MKRQFIPDNEISLTKENDFLKTGIYAKNLTKLIKNSPPNKVFTIGLFGNWGTGKSSIIETSKEYIEKENKKVKFITYDAWKYANDSFRRMFLLKIQQDLKHEQTNEMERFYKSINAEAKPKQVFNIKGLSISICALIVLALIVSTLKFEIEWKASILSVITLLGLLISVLNGFFHNLKISITKPSLFAPEQFEDCFKQMIEISLQKENCILTNLKKIVQFVSKGEATIVGLEKIVIVIDNIDRCHSSMAYQLLTDIKTFLSDEKYNIVFVVPVDDDALKKHLFNNSSNDEDQCNTEKEEFLRKFFNVTLRIKPYQTIEMQVFARELNKKYKLDFNNDTLSLAAKEFATNPRRVIQLFNNLSTEINFYEESFSSKNEAVICAIIIIREEYHKFYKAIVNNVNLLFGEYEKVEVFFENNELKSFMRLASSLFKNSKATEILRILTNTEALFTSIPQNIQTGIRNYSVIEIVTFFKEREDIQEDILQFIYKNIDEDLKYESELQIINSFEFVSRFCSQVNIEKLQYFDDKFISKYEVIIPKISDVNSVCQYANLLSIKEFHSLKESIIEYVANKDNLKNTNWLTFVNQVLSSFNNENDSKALSKFVDSYYSEILIDRSINYSEAQMKYLFTDNLIKTSIGQIEEVTFNDNIDELLWLFKNKPNISEQNYKEFFSHINSIIGDLRNKTQVEVLSIIEFLTPFIESIKDRQLKDEPKELYDKLFASRIVNNNSVNIIRESINNEEQSKKIIDFICTIYAKTNNSTSILKEINQLVDNYREYINSILNNKLLKAGFSLAPLFNLIINDTNYESNDTLSLTKNCFLKKNTNGTFNLTDAQIQVKLTSLLDNISNNGVKQLIEEIINDEAIKQILIDIITNRDSVFINSLPKSLLDLAINNFNSNTANNYTDNYNYLTIIAQKGEELQKSELVRILTIKISSDQNIKEVFSILEVIDSLKETDKNLIIASLESFIGRHNESENELLDEADKIIKKFHPKKKKKNEN